MKSNQVTNSQVTDNRTVREMIFKRKALKLGAFLFFGLFTSLICSNGVAECASDHFGSSGIVSSVHDGDTIRLEDGRKIRLIGINTPEMAMDGRPEEPLASEAKRMLANLLPIGKPVKLRYGEQKKDRYERVLAHVFTQDQLNVTAELIRKGYGFQVVIPPNSWGAECYRRLELLAQNEQLGVWKESFFRSGAADSIRLSGGYRFVIGQIEGITKNKHNVWINLKGFVALKINRKQWEAFKDVGDQLQEGQIVEARGWLADRTASVNSLNKKHKRWVMVLTHPYSIKLNHDR